MKPELSIIKLFLNHDAYTQYSTHLDAEDFPDDLRLIYRCLSSYHQTNEDDLHLQDLANLFFAHKPKDKEYYEALFENLNSYNPVEATVHELLKSIKESKLLKQLSLLAYEVDQKKKTKDTFLDLLQEYLKHQDEQEEEQDADVFVTDDLGELLSTAVKDPGLPWRLKCLNQSLGPLRRGDFGFVFARPETGKTTFLASEASHMLLHTENPILWFNNEEAGSKVKLRVYQAFFGVTLEELYGNVDHYSKLFKEQSQGRFKLLDSAQINRRDVEALCKKYNPGLVIFDQIDKLQGFDADREDLLLGRIYRWARELAKQYCPIIGVTQADGSGEGVRWLTMANVANAKTSKQAEADFILGIGCTQEQGWESVRFLNISKNKLIGTGIQSTNGGTPPTSNNRHGKHQVFINPELARYSDI